MGVLYFFLSLKIKQTKEGIMIHQQKFIKELVKKYKLENAKPNKTPMGISTRLDEDPSGICIDQTMYRGMIGSLIYLTANKPDISFSVGLCARFPANPKESHLKVVKRIHRYLKGTNNLGLFYPRSDSFDLNGFTDTDYAGGLVYRKSTSGEIPNCNPTENPPTSSTSTRNPKEKKLSEKEEEIVDIFAKLKELKERKNSERNVEGHIKEVEDFAAGIT
ncbi:uncharacterized protein LOC110691754 [Chenopodium quinoa]|uniref:uncharacterized protein LOC110691754 n=1 Tax=Chenopodium quinoa TaxID=63459 RepID=UPI000B79A972|nr:uncharacterized protein LOC110691754 [Chenopodium quinoa]